MRVYIPTPLRSYTQDAGTVNAAGATLDEMLHHLDRSYPGMRFRIIDEQDRIRRHIKIFVNEAATDDLALPLQAGDCIHIVCALSGG